MDQLGSKIIQIMPPKSHSADFIALTEDGHIFEASDGKDGPTWKIIYLHQPDETKSDLESD